ncbi:unnamed protein product, partial [Ilex paraguariensis]
MAASTIITSKYRASWSHIILTQLRVHSSSSSSSPSPRPLSTLHHSFPTTPRTTTTTHTCHFQTLPISHSHLRRGFRFPGNRFFSISSGKAIQELLADVEREKQKEREERKRAGLDTADIDAEDDEDYMGVGPIIEKLEKEKLKDTDTNLHLYEEPTDSDTDDDDERFTTDSIKKRSDEFEKKFKRHEELLKNFTDA